MGVLLSAFIPHCTWLNAEGANLGPAPHKALYTSQGLSDKRAVNICRFGTEGMCFRLSAKARGNVLCENACVVFAKLVFTKSNVGMVCKQEVRSCVADCVCV